MKNLTTLKTDLRARISQYETENGKFPLPAFVPVFDTMKNTISAQELKKEYDFDLLITSSYLYWKRNKEKGLETIHTALDYQGPIMTDSGAYQILAYGDIPLTPEQSIDIQIELKPDIAVILDVPISPRESYSQAEKNVAMTIERVKESAKIIQEKSPDNIVWTLPIQGGEHLELLQHYIQQVKADTDVFQTYDLYALGSIVPIMNAYKYSELFKMTKIVRKMLPNNKPLHLFGAGHPMVFPYLVALGADSFDSASYALFAEKDRYLTKTSTRHLQEMTQLSCYCPSCSQYTIKEMQELEKKERIRELSRHNLFVCQSVMMEIREAIYRGDLWEMLRRTEKSHPKLYSAFRNDFEDREYFKGYAHVSKRYGAKLYDSFDAFRPEIIEFRERADNVLKGSESNIDSDNEIHMCFGIPVRGIEKPAQIYLHPIIGLIPKELLAVYPAMQSVYSNETIELSAIAKESIKNFIERKEPRHICFKSLFSPERIEYAKEEVREILESYKVGFEEIK